MSTTTRTGNRERGLDRATLASAAVDGGLLTALVLAGQRRHEVDLLASPLEALETVLPFLIGWFAVALLAGLYERRRPTTVAGAVRFPAVVWIAGANVGLVLRSSDLFAGGSPYPFNLVMTGMGLVVIVGWRLVYAAVATRR